MLVWLAWGTVLGPTSYFLVGDLLEAGWYLPKQTHKAACCINILEFAIAIFRVSFCFKSLRMRLGGLYYVCGKGKETKT